MLKRRIIAAIAALLVAAVGGGLLLSYVSRADERAMAGMQTVEVLVASALIPEGTAADSLTKLVVVKSLPVKAVAPGALTTLAAVRGLVSAVDLLPGEQLLGARFVDPTPGEDAAEVKLPVGMQEVSVSLEQPRMLGSALAPGATVGVLLSLAEEGEQPAQTHFILHKVLVTKVGEPAPAGGAGADEPSPEPEPRAPAESMVTFAVTARDAEKLLFGAEHGRLWLTLEPTDASTSGTEVVTAGNVYR